MSWFKQWQTPHKSAMQPAHILVPALAGVSMFCASFLPWLRYPLGEVYSAWRIPIDLGWQIRIPLFNYGLLCIVCALPALVIAYQRLMQEKKREKAMTETSRSLPRLSLAAICCIIPIMLFVFQYLCVDMQGTNSIARQEVQILLIKGLYDYRLPGQLVPLQPFDVDNSTLVGRMALLINQVAPGLAIPCLCAWLLTCYQSLLSIAPSHLDTSPPRARARITFRLPGRPWLIAAAIGALILSRPIIAMFCDYQGRQALSVGNYITATKWLEAAGTLNPTLDQMPYFHIQRGQADYFLHPGTQSNDSRIYLASVYLAQRNYLGAYHEMRAIEDLQRHIPSWEVDVLSKGLSRLADTARRRNDPTIQRSDLDAAVLPWLQMMMQVDPSNVYAHYLMGRIDYELHDYDGNTVQMTTVLRLSRDADLQSSAYTYMALGKIEQGQVAAARALLLKAVTLDPGYWNNTAREELSGLH